VPPVAAAGGDKTVDVGSVVTFDGSASRDPDGTIVASVWDFGDGAGAAGALQTHTYWTPGRYTAKLTVQDNSGRDNDRNTDTIEVTVLDVPNVAPVAAAGGDKTVEVGSVVTFDGSASRDPDGAIVAYEWDFGDGIKAAGGRQTHTYWTPGRYTAKLTVQDNSGRDNDRNTDTIEVTVLDVPNVPPIASAGDDRTAVVGEIITFDGSASRDPDGNIVTYRWDFGNGASASGKVARYAYQQTGTYTVTLTVTDDSGRVNATSSSTVKVTIEPKPNAPPRSRADVPAAAAIQQALVLDASRSDDSDGNIITYQWDFGDGSTSSLMAPTHAYAAPGIYTATLTVEDDSSAPNAKASSQYRIVVNDPPRANAGPDQTVTDSQVAFDGRGSFDSDGRIVDYAWSFGDGQAGSGPTPVHVYRQPGRYEVTLTVTDDSGTIDNVGTDKMTVVINEPPVADAGRPRIAVPGEELEFDGSKSRDPDGTIVAYDWDFGDGTAAIGRTVKHTFARSGVYNVRLSVRDNTGDAAAVGYAEARVVINAPPVARLGSDRRIAPGEDVMIDASQSFDPDGRIMRFVWELDGERQPERGAEITRRFDAPGRHVLRLLVIDDSDAPNGTAEAQVVIAVNHPPVAVAGQDILTDQRRVLFDGSGSYDPDGDGLSYTWDFGDGTSGQGVRVIHTYEEGGVYQATLSVDDGIGLSNSKASATRQIRVNRRPIADAGKDKNMSVCRGDTVTFDAKGSHDPDGDPLKFAWDFGDGTKADGRVVIKSFKKTGYYPVMLFANDATGLPNQEHADRVFVRVDRTPIAVAGPDVKVCVNQEVRFDASKSSDLGASVNKFTWRFGDGSSGAGERPVHVYTRPGYYQVGLVAEGDPLPRCSNIATDWLTVRVEEAPTATIKAPDAAATGKPIKFVAEPSSEPSDPAVRSWEWEFGDGQTAEGPSAAHTYETPGVFQVELTLKGDATSSGCSSSRIVHGITINAPPVAEFVAPARGMVGEPVLFDATPSGDPDGMISAYKWDFGDGAKGEGVRASHAYRSPGQYTVKLTVTDNSQLENGSASTAKVVTVEGGEALAIGGPDVTCPGSKFDLTVEAGGPTSKGRFDYRWLLAGGESQKGERVSSQFERPGRYDVTVFALDEAERVHGQASKSITVNGRPVAVAGPAQLVCPGAHVVFDGSRSSDSDGQLVEATWDFGDGQTSDKLRTVHVYQKSGTYRARLTVRDNSRSACDTASDVADVVVNAPPVAVAGPDQTAYAGGANDVVTLDGSKSHVPDGKSLSFYWRVGSDTMGTGERLRHRFTQPGRYQVVMTVSDSTGLPCGTATDSLYVTVQDRPQ
jgi:PKD repeat protein